LVRKDDEAAVRPDKNGRRGGILAAFNTPLGISLREEFLRLPRSVGGDQDAVFAERCADNAVSLGLGGGSEMVSRCLLTAARVHAPDVALDGFWADDLSSEGRKLATCGTGRETWNGRRQVIRAVSIIRPCPTAPVQVSGRAEPSSKTTGTLRPRGAARTRRTRFLTLCLFS
jgi:hypothetical protein